MEDGCTEETTVTVPPPLLNNGEVCSSEEVAKKAGKLRINGDSKSESESENSDKSDHSESDNLVIDEQPRKSRKRKILSSKSKNGFRGFKIPKTSPKPYEPPTNPYFNESLFELSELHNKGCSASSGEENRQTHVKNVNKKKHSSPKLREYAQYLGLQPTVQFKCSKCGVSGFETLTSLNEHHLQCSAERPIIASNTSKCASSGSTNFRVTRKVFLCSACGTYYENWNLFLHMREVHKRFICLYCLGMFSLPEKLSLHLLTKHNCVPNRFNTADEFFNLHSDPCYIMCCNCETVFTEQENFIEHVCEGKSEPRKSKMKNPGNSGKQPSNAKLLKNKSFIEHVTGDNPESSNETNENRPNENSATNMEEESQCVDENSKKASLISTETENEGNNDVKEETGKCDKDNSSADEVKENDEPGSEEIEKQGGSEEMNTNDEGENESEHEEPRRVPKVTLKLPKNISLVEQEDSDISDKLEAEDDPPGDSFREDSIQIAGPEVPIIELELEQPLDKFDIQQLLKKCLKETIPTCVYCNYARKIAVNGKQLGLHTIAEHRFSAIVNSITAEELIPESFVAKIKENLPELEASFFNIDSTSSNEAVTFSHIFECFQCRYATTVHKELYIHNRKMHSKTILLCIMCKSNFYSYSELICHLCPGLYDLENDISFRCCMCISDVLPSAFRLMVHLRKRHHICDVCLELCHNQSRLSNHVWKHKLHHLCYRCGIAYRNKPDITKHLFWKHGTESQLCQRCLQKKWPHVYHFCIPPSTFTCEECSLSFTKAIFLKVHKRLHSSERPYACTFESCSEAFISKKLLLKHEFKHREPVEEALESKCSPVPGNVEDEPTKKEGTENSTISEEGSKNIEEKPKPKVDVYDLPELNLSESDSSESEHDSPQKEATVCEKLPETETLNEPDLDGDRSVPILENIWDDFKNYQATKEKTNEPEPSCSFQAEDENRLLVSLDVIMNDHDYCSVPKESDPIVESGETQSVDHNYCSSVKEEPEEKGVAPVNDVKPEVSSGSDSSSSSCTCGSNCSCSSSSSSSSSLDSSDSDSSTSEGRRRQQARRERRKARGKSKKESENSTVDVIATDNNQLLHLESNIEESDLDTTESETDEDFYDKQPQKLANKFLAEKRNQMLLLAGIGPLINGSILESSRPSTPNLPEVEEIKPKKKSKSKKRKKKSKRDAEKRRKHAEYIPNTNHFSSPLPQNCSPTVPTVNSVISTLTSNSALNSVSDDNSGINLEEANQRASKRRRVPNKFYGYSSDEEQEKHLPPVLKWRKADLPTPPPRHPPAPTHIVPPITIKTLPPQSPLLNPLPVTTDIGHHPPRVPHHPIFPPPRRDMGTESEESSTEEDPQVLPKLNPPPLYCYCRCPYDEVSEMIGCDSDDCDIEWFHFECVGIMVPPKGQWFCPDCRKKRQQRGNVNILC